MHHLAAAATALLLGFSAIPLASAGTVEDFDRQFRATLEAFSVPGGAYAIVHDGRILRAGGHGRLAMDSDQPVTPDTVFRIASVSKTFAAELAGLLVQQGALGWDATLDTLLPGFHFGEPNHAGLVQLRHVLGQSAGITPYAYDNLLNANVPLERILPLFRELKPICAPGSCYTYQNILFGLVGQAIENAADDSYGALMQKRIFGPLQMQHASVGMEAFLAVDDRARPHIRQNGEWITTDVMPGYYQVAPAAGVNASARDLGTWLIAQLGGHPEIIPPALVEELTQKRIRTAKDLRRKHWRDMLTDAHYGLGWRIYQVGDEALYLHSGWVQGYVADIAYSRDRRIGLVVLLNAETSLINQITTTFWKDVLGGTFDPGGSIPAADASADPAEDDMGD